METITDYNLEILDLSEKITISYTLDLIKFDKLIELDCSNNVLTNLYNLSPHLVKLDCSNKLFS